MTIRTLVNRIKRSAGKLGETLQQKYSAAVMPYWFSQAKRQRETLCGAYVVITGSCGKSTTTMLTSTLLGAQGVVGSGILYNTARRVMRALRKLSQKVDFFVQEASEYPRGTLANVAALKPDVAIVTSVGLDHLDGFRTRETVAREIGTLTAAIGPTGTVCLNADDSHARGLAGGTSARVLLFGRAADADVRAENVHSHLPERLGFDLVIGERRWRVQTRFVGTLMLTNILGALTAIHVLGRDMDRAVADLAQIEPLHDRMGIVEVRGGHTFLVDTRKAPGWSTRLVIDDLPNMSPGRRILVLGELSDIGSNSGKKYRQILRGAVGKADLVVAVRQARDPAARLIAIDPSLSVRPVSDDAELEALLRAQPPSLVVLKGNKVRIDAMLERFASPPASMPA